jgi:hypothetical protein
MVRGDKVYFGRAHGEKTLGEVVKVNGKSVKVKQLESRGTMKNFAVGTIWRVALSLVSPVTGAVSVPSEPKSLPQAPQAPAVRRPEAAILKDILGVYSHLSPENLHQDGEISASAARRHGVALRAKLNTLFVEIGRRVDEEEAYRLAGSF